MLASLMGLLDSLPRAHGYLWSRWSSELLAIELHRRTGVQVHATTVRRWLKRLGFGYRRTHPTLRTRDPNKSERMEAIAATLADSGPDCEVFYVDEADIDLSPENRSCMDGLGQAEQDSYSGSEPEALPGRRVECAHRQGGVDRARTQGLWSYSYSPFPWTGWTFYPLRSRLPTTSDGSASPCSSPWLLRPS